MAQLKRAHDETPWWARLSVLIVGLVLAGLLIVVLDFTSRVKEAAEQNRVNSIVACYSANQGRQADIVDLTSDLVLLRASALELEADIAGLRVRVPEGTEWLAAKRASLEATRAAIALKRRSIDDQLAAVAEYAVRPGSPLKDCQKAFPE